MARITQHLGIGLQYFLLGKIVDLIWALGTGVLGP